MNRDLDPDELDAGASKLAEAVDAEFMEEWISSMLEMYGLDELPYKHVVSIKEMLHHTPYQALWSLLYDGYTFRSPVEKSEEESE